MEEIVNRFMDASMEESKRTRQFILDFKNCQEYMIKEQNNMIMELQFAVHKLTTTVRKSLCKVNEAKGITTRGGRTTSIEPNRKEQIDETTVDEGRTEPVIIPVNESGNNKGTITLPKSRQKG